MKTNITVDDIRDYVEGLRLKHYDLEGVELVEEDFVLMKKR